MHLHSACNPHKHASRSCNATKKTNSLRSPDLRLGMLRHVRTSHMHAGSTRLRSHRPRRRGHLRMRRPRRLLGRTSLLSCSWKNSDWRSVRPATRMYRKLLESATRQSHLGQEGLPRKQRLRRFRNVRPFGRFNRHPSLHQIAQDKLFVWASPVSTRPSLHERTIDGFE